MSQKFKATESKSTNAESAVRFKVLSKAGGAVESVDANGDGTLDIRDLVRAKKLTLASSGPVKQANEYATGAVKKALFEKSEAEAKANKELRKKENAVNSSKKRLEALESSMNKIQSEKKALKKQTGYNFLEQALNTVGQVPTVFDRYNTEYKKLKADYEREKSNFRTLNADYTESKIRNRYDMTGDSYLAYLKEKKKSTDSVTERKELQKQIDDVRNGLYGEGSLGKFIYGNIDAGAAQFNKSLSATADFTLGNLFKAFGWKNNPVSKWNQFHTELSEKAQSNAEYQAKALGSDSNTSGKIIQGAVAALPDAVLAVMTSGISSTAPLGAKASALTGTAAKAVESVAKNPLYWTSFAKELGTGYEEARAQGAEENAATLYSLLSSTVNAVVEVGSGIEALPTAIREAYGKKRLFEWVKASVDEGREEVVQGIISQLTSKLLYDGKKSAVSLSDPNAVINPKRMAEEFGMGAAVGGILGGAQLSLDSVLNAKTEADYKKMGAQLLAHKRSDIKDIINYSKSSLNPEIRALASRTDVNRISKRTAGILYGYTVNDISQAIRSPESSATANLNYSKITETDSEVIKSIASSQYALRMLESTSGSRNESDFELEATNAIEDRPNSDLSVHYQNEPGGVLDADVIREILNMANGSEQSSEPLENSDSALNSEYSSRLQTAIDGYKSLGYTDEDIRLLFRIAEAERQTDSLNNTKRDNAETAGGAENSSGLSPADIVSKYSIAEDLGNVNKNFKNPEKSSIKQQLIAYLETLKIMPQVTKIDEYTDFSTKTKQESLDWIMSRIGRDGEIYRKNFGKIIFDRKRISRGWSYLKTTEEKLCILAVPSVLENGIEIGIHHNHKGRLYDTITFAAPIEIMGHRVNMAVVVRQEEGNYYKVHRLLMPDGTNVELYENRDNAETAGGAENSSGLSPADIVSTDSISNPSDNVNNYLSLKADKRDVTSPILSAEPIAASRPTRKHLTKSEQSYISQICEKLGIDVCFEDMSAHLRSIGKSTDGAIPDGYIDSDGTVHIGYTVTNPLGFVLKHELTHFGDSTPEYLQFKRSVEKSGEFKAWLKQKTRLSSDSLSELKAEYMRRVKLSRAEVELLSEQALFDEMLADFAGDCLFTENGTGLEGLLNGVACSERPAIIRYILDFLSYIKAKIYGEEKLSLEIYRLENSYKRMLAQAVAQAQISDFSEPYTRYSFVMTEEVDKIAAAEADEKNGATEKEVWQKYGIIRDNRGIWLREITDHRMELRILGDAVNPEFSEFLVLRFKKRRSRAESERFMQLRKKYSEKCHSYTMGELEDFIIHDELFEKHPELRSINFTIFPQNENGDLGCFIKEKNTLLINPDLIENYYKTINKPNSVGHQTAKNKLYGVIVHEMQHAIQHYESRENGSSIEYWMMRARKGDLPFDYETQHYYFPSEAYLYTAGEIEAKSSETRNKMTENERLENLPDFKRNKAVFTTEYYGSK